MTNNGKCFNRSGLILTTVFSVLSISMACAPESQVRRVDGVREIVYTVSEPPAIDPYEVELSLIFGTDQGEDTYFFNLPTPQTITDDGVLYVVDARSTKLHWFDPDGAHLGMFGTKGEGPGEFPMALQDCIIDGGRILINDPFTRRINLFDMEGEYLDAIQYSETTVSSPVITLYGPHENRQFLVARPLRRRETSDATFRLIRHNEHLEAIDTPIELILPIETVQLGRSDVTVPIFHEYLPESALEVDLPAAWAYTHQFRIDFLDPTDLSRWAVIIPFKPQPVSRDLREETIQNYARYDSEEAARRRLRFTETLPYINYLGLRWDLTGRLWVQEFRDRTVENLPFRCHVFAKDGTWLFRQDLPKRPALITGEGFYARGELDDGTPVVEFYAFTER